MIVAVPPATPVTIPLPEPIVAIAALLLVHAPAPEASVNVTEEPTHTGALPIMGFEVLITVTVVVAKQLPVNIL